MTDAYIPATKDSALPDFISSIDKSLYYDWGGFNLWLFKHINALDLGSSYDMAMVLISRMSAQHNFPYYLALMALYVALVFLVYKVRGHAGSKGLLSMWLGVLIMFNVGFAVNAASVLYLKDHFQYPRPYVVLEHDKVRVLEDLKQENSHRSFPSGHVAFATLVVLCIGPAVSSGTVALGLLFVAMVAWSRIAVGAHFPADVLGGFLETLIVVSVLRIIVYRVLRSFGIRC